MILQKNKKNNKNKEKYSKKVEYTNFYKYGGEKKMKKRRRRKFNKIIWIQQQHNSLSKGKHPKNQEKKYKLESQQKQATQATQKKSFFSSSWIRKKEIYIKMDVEKNEMRRERKEVVV